MDQKLPQKTRHCETALALLRGYQNRHCNNACSGSLTFYVSTRAMPPRNDD
ncbi:hypothetical protein [Rickettsia endosymbiont of Ceutorhynchus obstrictus]|uniref:hypothetical protein n=1 Tax=Rickettsia endosymbiont of Ceutorhynchus obstrictus TaxID=3066249 RepID=UPI0031335186